MESHDRQVDSGQTGSGRESLQIAFCHKEKIMHFAAGLKDNKTPARAAPHATALPSIFVSIWELGARRRRQFVPLRLGLEADKSVLPTSCSICSWTCPSWVCSGLGPSRSLGSCLRSLRLTRALLGDQCDAGCSEIMNI